MTLEGPFGGGGGYLPAALSDDWRWLEPRHDRCVDCRLGAQHRELRLLSSCQVWHHSQVYRSGAVTFRHGIARRQRSRLRARPVTIAGIVKADYSQLGSLVIPALKKGRAVHDDQLSCGL